MIREFIEKEVSEDVAKYLRIIYAGPVSKDNSSDLIKLKDVDGFLVHNEPSMSEEFDRIVQDVNHHYRSY